MAATMNPTMFDNITKSKPNINHFIYSNPRPMPKVEELSEDEIKCNIYNNNMTSFEHKKYRMVIEKLKLNSTLEKSNFQYYSKGRRIDVVQFGNMYFEEIKQNGKTPEEAVYTIENNEKCYTGIGGGTFDIDYIPYTKLLEDNKIHMMVDNEVSKKIKEEKRKRFMMNRYRSQPYNSNHNGYYQPSRFGNPRFGNPNYGQMSFGNNSSDDENNEEDDDDDDSFKMTPNYWKINALNQNDNSEKDDNQDIDCNQDNFSINSDNIADFDDNIDFVEINGKPNPAFNINLNDIKTMTPPKINVEINHDLDEWDEWYGDDRCG
jgi:hypothetical protein